MKKHSPLPWRDGGDFIIDAEGISVKIYWTEQGAMNRHLIVRAVNSHAALLAAAMAASDLFKILHAEDEDSSTYPVHNALKAAIAAATKEDRVMTYDQWKTTEPDNSGDLPEEGNELDELYKALAQSDLRISSLHDENVRLRASRAVLLATAKRTVEHANDLCLLEFRFASLNSGLPSLRAAIAAAEEITT